MGELGSGAGNPEGLETAYPFRPDRFEEPEPQEARGAPGSRGMGNPPQAPSEKGRAADSTGVNPLDPILPEMPYLKPGDQGG